MNLLIKKNKFLGKFKDRIQIKFPENMSLKMDLLT